MEIEREKDGTRDADGPARTPPADLLVRPLTETDAEAFLAVRLRALREHPEAFLQSEEEAASQPLDEVRERMRPGPAGAERVVVGAFVSSELVGLLGCARQVPRKVRHKAIIWGMYVSSGARRAGIAAALLGEAIARARGWGVEQLHLGVMTENSAARRLYIGTGFRPYGIEPRALRLDGAGTEEARRQVRYLDEEHLVLML